MPASECEMQMACQLVFATISGVPWALQILLLCCMRSFQRMWMKVALRTRRRQAFSPSSTSDTLNQANTARLPMILQGWVIQVLHTSNGVAGLAVQGTQGLSRSMEFVIAAGSSCFDCVLNSCLRSSVEQQAARTIPAERSIHLAAHPCTWIRCPGGLPCQWQLGCTQVCHRAASGRYLRPAPGCSSQGMLLPSDVQNSPCNRNAALW